MVMIMVVILVIVVTTIGYDNGYYGYNYRNTVNHLRRSRKRPHMKEPKSNASERSFSSVIEKRLRKKSKKSKNKRLSETKKRKSARSKISCS